MSHISQHVYILPTIKPSKNKYNFHSLLGFVGAFVGNPADMVNVR